MQIIDFVVGCLLCFGLGVTTAYLDIRSFFVERRIGIASVFRQGATVVFFAANGLAGVSLLAWAELDPDGPLNALLPFESATLKGLLIGISVPALIRSKWFSVTTSEGTAPAGFETLYEWVRREVLHCVHVNAIHLRRRIAHAYAARLERREDVPDQLYQRVKEEAALFRNPEQLNELEQEYANIARFYADEPASRRHLEELFLWAMNNSGIGFAEHCLREIEQG